MASENVSVAEVLALRPIVRVLLVERIREFKDGRAAVFDFAKMCSTLVNETRVSGPDPDGIKQEALRHLDNIFSDLGR